MMKSKEFIDRLVSIASDYKTIYVNGTWGWVMNDTNKVRACKKNQYNINHKDVIYAAPSDSFGWDCSGVAKGVLWGWTGDLSKPYGGAGYACNGVPDVNEVGMLAACTNVSTDFSTIKPGEAVFITGHVGYYIGNGLAVECTPKWKNGVQITACNCDVPGYNRRNWTKHGFLPWIDYSEVPEGKTPVDITYQVYAAKHWMPNVVNQNDYAGTFNNAISGVYANASLGNLYLKVHEKDNKWLPEVENRNDYAGNLGKDIDAIMIRSDITAVHYKVHTGGRWLSPVTGYDEKDNKNGYAGNIGETIDAIQIWADPVEIIEEPIEEDPVFLVCPLCGYSMSVDEQCSNPLCKNSPDYHEPTNPTSDFCEQCGSELDMRGNCMNEDCPCCPSYHEPIQEIPKEVLRGDFNGDGKVDKEDATYILYHTFYPEEYPLNQDADFDKDGVITSKDSTYLLHHIENPEKYPLDKYVPIDDSGEKQEEKDEVIKDVSAFKELVNLIVNTIKSLLKKLFGKEE